MAHLITVGVIIGIVIFFYLLHKILDFLQEKDLESYIGLFVVVTIAYVLTYVIISNYLTLNN